MSPPRAGVTDPIHRKLRPNSLHGDPQSIQVRCIRCHENSDRSPVAQDHELTASIEALEHPGRILSKLGDVGEFHVGITSLELSA